MRFFCFACFFGIVVASIGCMTRNWSMPLFNGTKNVEQKKELLPFQSTGAMGDQLFGNASGKTGSRGLPSFTTASAPDF